MFHFIMLQNKRQVLFASSSAKGDLVGTLQAGLAEIGVTDVELEPPPEGVEEEYATLLTPAAVKFVADLTRQFNSQVDSVG